MKFHQVVAVIAIVGITGAGIFLSSQSDPEAHQRAVDNGRVQAPRVFDSLAAPPNAKPIGPRTTREVNARKRNEVILEQRFEAPGRIEDTINWYRKQLEPKGWLLVDADLPTLAWERDPWRFEMQQDTWSFGSNPSHEFTARLRWEQYR